MSVEETTTTVHVKNATDHPLVVILEPWAHEIPLLPGAEFDIVESQGRRDQAIEIVVAAGTITVWGREGAYISVPKDGKSLL